MRLRAMAPLAFLLIAGLGAGCSDDPAKQPASPKPSAAKPVATQAVGPVRRATSPSPRTTAAALDPKTAAEAQAFVREFMAASDRATASGDFSTVKPWVAKDCGPCQASIAYFTKLYAAGGSVEGGTFLEPKLSAQAADKGAVRVTVKATIAKYTLKQGGGRGTDYPAERVTYTYTVSKTQAGWRVVGRSF